MRELQKRGRDTLRTNGDGETGWQLAVRSGHHEVLATLRDGGTKGHMGLALELALEATVAAEDALLGVLGELSM
jgi:hypothetical protein